MLITGACALSCLAMPPCIVLAGSSFWSYYGWTVWRERLWGRTLFSLALLDTAPSSMQCQKWIHYMPQDVWLVNREKKKVIHSAIFHKKGEHAIVDMIPCERLIIVWQLQCWMQTYFCWGCEFPWLEALLPAGTFSSTKTSWSCSLSLTVFASTSCKHKLHHIQMLPFTQTMTEISKASEAHLALVMLIVASTN